VSAFERSIERSLKKSNNSFTISNNKNTFQNKDKQDTSKLGNKKRSNSSNNARGDGMPDREYCQNSTFILSKDTNDQFFHAPEDDEVMEKYYSDREFTDIQSVSKEDWEIFDSVPPKLSIKRHEQAMQLFEWNQLISGIHYKKYEEITKKAILNFNFDNYYFNQSVKYKEIFNNKLLSKSLYTLYTLYPEKVRIRLEKILLNFID